jgi:hypothetical protein
MIEGKALTEQKLEFTRKFLVNGNLDFAWVLLAFLAYSSQSNSGLALSNPASFPNLRSLAPNRLQQLLPMQNLHKRIRKTIRRILRKRIHKKGKRRQQTWLHRLHLRAAVSTALGNTGSFTFQHILLRENYSANLPFNRCIIQFFLLVNSTTETLKTRFGTSFKRMDFKCYKNQIG